jgi:hypothetical protein
MCTPGAKIDEATEQHHHGLHELQMGAFSTLEEYQVRDFNSLPMAPVDNIWKRSKRVGGRDLERRISGLHR